jgi:hypothetical protein
LIFVRAPSSIFAMNPLLLVVLNVVAGAAGVGLFYYVLYRAVLSAKKKGRAGIGGQLMATALTLSSAGALDPAREVATEAQKLKRNQDGNGDPDIGRRQGAAHRHDAGL